MKIFTIISLFLFLSLNNISFCQSNSENQSYTYSNEIIKVEVAADKHYFKKSDTVKFKITVTNLSTDTLLVFPNVKYKTYWGDKPSINFELGGDYYSDISILDSLKIITESKKNIYKVSIPATDFRTDSLYKYARVFLSFSYISTIKEFKHLKKYKDFWRKGDYYYTGSAEIFRALERLNLILFALEQNQ